MLSPRRPPTLFTDHRYLDALERSGCVRPENGWTPMPLQIGSARMPCYAKAHSWGEFVFDFELARFWQRRGLPYYPKLVCCVPFTPVPGARLLADTPSARRDLALRFREKAADGYSGAHILYPADDERRLLRDDGWIERAQLRYVWHSRNEPDFDGFLARLDARRRKNIRAERRKLTEFTIRWRDGASFDAAEWARVAALYASTYRIRGQSPYLNLDCLRRWAIAFGTQMPFCLAYHRHQLVAMAFFFEDGDTLYGRHWGSDAQYDGLHFELCYYQGIARCLERGLAHFDAGVQGEHKRTRGFTTELAWSLHHFPDTDAHALIAEAYAREAAQLEQIVAADRG